MYNRIANLGFLMFVGVIVVVCLVQGMLLPREHHNEDHEKMRNADYQSSENMEAKETQ